MPVPPGTAKTAFLAAYNTGLAALVAAPPITPAQMQELLGNSVEAAVNAVIPFLSVVNPTGLTTATGGGPVVGVTGPGSIG